MIKWQIIESTPKRKKQEYRYDKLKGRLLNLQFLKATTSFKFFTLDQTFVYGIQI